MILTTRSLILGGLFGLAVTTGLAATAIDREPMAAPKGDLLAGPSLRGGPEVLVFNTDENTSVVVRPNPSF